METCAIAPMRMGCDRWCVRWVMAPARIRDGDRFFLLSSAHFNCCILSCQCERMNGVRKSRIFMFTGNRLSLPRIGRTIFNLDRVMMWMHRGMTKGIWFGPFVCRDDDETNERSLWKGIAPDATCKTKRNMNYRAMRLKIPVWIVSHTQTQAHTHTQAHTSFCIQTALPPDY